MEFIARTVIGPPSDKIDEKTARSRLEKHPQFKPGSVIVAMEQQGGKWVAKLHEPKVAAPPPFGESGPPSGEDSPPPSEPKKEDGPPKDEGEGGEKPKNDKDNKDDATGEKISIEKVFDLVQQIAQAVGVAGAGPAGLDGPPGAGPAGPALGPHATPPEGGPPHDETSQVPGSPDTKQIIHRKAPPGATPVGSPAFASTQSPQVPRPKVASFQVEEPVPDDFPIKQAKEEIEAMYGPHGYKVKRIREDRSESGERVIRALVSVR
jgi:hypothetical protein